MPARGEMVLRVSFGPAATPVLERAVALAAEHAEHPEQVGRHGFRDCVAAGGHAGTGLFLDGEPA